MAFVATHDRLTLEAKADGVRSIIDFVMCNNVKFSPFWISSEVSINREGDSYIKIFDGDFEVICMEALRWQSEGDEKPAVRITRNDI